MAKINEYMQRIKMNQRQKNKFHKAIKSLSDLMQELNSGCESWELHYSNSDCKFSLYKLQFDGSQNEIEQDDTNFPWMYMEE